MGLKSQINKRNPHAAAGPSAAVVAGQAFVQQYLAAAPGTPVTLPSYITPERAAILAGTAPAPAPKPETGPTIIKPAPGQTVTPPPAPTPPPVFDDTDDTADHAPTNPYLSLLGDGPATLTDTSSTSTTTGNDDAAGGNVVLLVIIGGVLTLLFVLWRWLK